VVSRTACHHFSQHGPDRVAFGQQPVIQASNPRAATADDPVPEPLGGAADPCQRPVRDQQDGAEDGEQHEPGDAENGGMHEPAANRRASQHGGQREDGQRQQATDAEQ
jgi:hypothetical protein